MSISHRAAPVVCPTLCIIMYAEEDEDASLLARLTSSLENDDGVDCLDVMIQLLERENTMTSSSSMTSSRTGYISRLSHCVSAACTDFEQQLQVFLVPFSERTANVKNGRSVSRAI